MDHVDGCDTLPMLHSLPSPASLQLLLQGALVGPGEDLNDGRLGVQPQANPVTQREIDGCSAFEQALTPALVFDVHFSILKSSLNSTTLHVE